MLPAMLAVATAAAKTATAAAGAVATAAAKPIGSTTPQTIQLNPTDFGYLHKSPLALNAPWLTHTFAFLFLVSAVLLVLLLASQTTKNEGLSGTVGGRVDSNIRRFGLEGQISRLTSYTAIAFVVLATIISISGI